MLDLTELPSNHQEDLVLLWALCLPVCLFLLWDLLVLLVLEDL